MVGQAAGVLEAALASTEAVVEHFETVVQELRIACFCTGSRTVAELKRAPLIAAPPGFEADAHEG